MKEKIKTYIETIKSFRDEVKGDLEGAKKENLGAAFKQIYVEACALLEALHLADAVINREPFVVEDATKQTEENNG